MAKSPNVTRGSEPRHPGRPPLSERQREAAKLEIALAAVPLFTEKGISGTSVGDVAEAVGVSTRTLWRYFPTKEAFVRPLLSLGMDVLLSRVHDWPADRPLLEAMEQVSTVGAERPESLGHLRALVRMTATEPGLRAVWMDVYYQTATALVDLIAERSGLDAGSLEVRVRAFALNSAILSAVETWAFHTDADTPADAIRTALRVVADGLPDHLQD
jgi:AcrR family transcriptional regulator